MKPDKNIKPSREIDGEAYDLLVAMENGEIEFEVAPDQDRLINEAITAAKNYFEKNPQARYKI